MEEFRLFKIGVGLCLLGSLSLSFLSWEWALLLFGVVTFVFGLSMVVVYSDSIQKKEQEDE